MTGKEYFLIDAEARSELLREKELPDLDHSPWEIGIHVTVNGYDQSSCWKGPLLVRTSFHGSKGTRTLKDRRIFRAQDLGQRHDAPTTDDDEEDYELYLKEHGNEARKLHRREDALYDAWRDEEDIKLRELLQAKEWAPSTPTPPNGSRSASSPDSALYPPDPPPLSSLSGEASKTTKNRQPPSGPRKTHGYSLHTAGISLPIGDPPSPPNGTPVCTPTPLEGVARAH